MLPPSPSLLGRGGSGWGALPRTHGAGQKNLRATLEPDPNIQRNKDMTLPNKQSDRQSQCSGGRSTGRRLVLQRVSQKWVPVLGKKTRANKHIEHESETG